METLSQKKKKTASEVAEMIRKNKGSAPKQKIETTATEAPKDDKPWHQRWGLTDEGGKSTLLAQAALPALTTGLGLAFGGAQGGAIGAEAGGSAITKFQKAQAERAKEEKKEAKEAAAAKAKAAKEKKEMGFKEQELDIKRKEAGIKGQERGQKRTTDLLKTQLGMPTTKDTQAVQSSYKRILSTAKDPSAAGDLALIFNYMKMLDPGSVVRESEFRTADQARAWLDRSEKEGIPIPSAVKQAIQKFNTGQRLLPDQRKDFVNQASNLYSAQLEAQRTIDEGLRQRAGMMGADPGVLLQWEQPQQGVPAGPEAPEQGPSMGPQGQSIIDKALEGTGLKPPSAIAKPDYNTMSDEELEKLYNQRIRK